jgi:hypothetical protein
MADAGAIQGQMSQARGAANAAFEAAKKLVDTLF